MKIQIPKELNRLGRAVKFPLYVVGGFVRNYLIAGFISEDIDICAPVSTDEFITACKDNGFNIVGEYKRTGTVVACCNKQKYEFTSFRTDVYSEGGGHKPISTAFTTDIKEDALRRDFKCNAVYYDIKSEEIIDPLKGVSDIEKRVISTVKNPEEVFASDGLRLMRLARQSAELNFRIDEKTLKGAKKYAENVKDISAERIYEELKKILSADGKYHFSDKRGHYNGLKVLSETGVLDVIIPELAKGRGLYQRSDYHKYDVLEHIFRAVLYSPKEIRLSALLHDVGKPSCYKEGGHYSGHDVVGKEIAGKILERLKADNKTKKEVCFLVGEHMKDIKGDMGVNKVKLFIVENYPYIEKLLNLMQADYSACKDDLSISLTVKKWRKILKEMKEENTPFTEKGLDITAEEMINIGIKKEDLGKVRKALLRECVIAPKLNVKERLIRIAKTFDKGEKI